MVLVIGVLIGLFVVPDEWTVPVIAAAAVLEIAETFVSIRIARRFGRPKAGPERLLGATGRAVTTCRPRGQVRVHGEVWQAHCAVGADVDDRIRVIARDRLVLEVEPVSQP
jgi:membrane-bound serine protease (ClpP class)